MSGCKPTDLDRIHEMKCRSFNTEIIELFDWALEENNRIKASMLIKIGERMNDVARKARYGF